MPEFNTVRPEYPFALMNHHHIVVPYKPRLHNSMGEKAFNRGKFKENAVVIDVNCRKFPVLDVINIGKAWSGSAWNPLTWPSYLFFSDSYDNEIRVRYVYGEPIQLTFDEARAEIVDLICGRRWHGQTGASEKYFREVSAQCKDMRDFLVGEYGIGFYGRWMLHYIPPHQKSK